MRRPYFLLASVTLVATAACSGPNPESDPTTTPSATAAATDSPEPTESAAPTGTEPASATLDVGWTVPFSLMAPSEWERDSSTGETFWIKATVDRWVAFTREDPETVDAWVEHVTGAPQVVATEPVAIELDGASGFVLDVTLGPEAGESPCNAGPVRCWTLFQGAGGFWEVIEGRPSRIWVVDVEGETVLIVTDAPERAFESWTETVGDALSTIEWGP